MMMTDSAQKPEENDEAISYRLSRFLRSTGYEMSAAIESILANNSQIEKVLQEQNLEGALQYTQQTKTDCEVLQELINDCFHFFETVKIPRRPSLSSETFDIAQTVQTVINAIQPLATKNHNTLSIDCADGLGSMHTDRRRVRQVLINLLSNACKFTENGQVSLHAYRKTREHAETIVFKVIDTGIGIPSDLQQHLFDFKSSDDTHYGLPISYAFCQQLGGTIFVDSEQGKGSTFTVSLPAQVAGAC